MLRYSKCGRVPDQIVWNHGCVFCGSSQFTIDSLTYDLSPVEEHKIVVRVLEEIKQEIQDVRKEVSDRLERIERRI